MTKLFRHALSPFALGLSITLLLTSPIGALAQSSAANATAPATSKLPLVQAEVRRVDAANGKITLKHAEIPNLDMPPMTMVFQVGEPALLEGVKQGDMVRVTLDKVNGAYTVLSLQPAP